MENKAIKDIGLILVIGATGTQGGATVRHLLKNGHKVRAVTRNPDKPSELISLSKQYPGKLEVVKGDYEDSASLEAALIGVTGVFSVQLPNMRDKDGEVRHGTLLIELAKRAGVKVFVHTSVAKTGEHESFPRWSEGYWDKIYWLPKWEIQEAVKRAGFDYYTILKPALFMEDFKPPKSNLMYPALGKKGEIITVVKPDTKLDLIAADDIGLFACAAFENPEAFNKHSISLASEALTMDQIVDSLNKAWNQNIKVIRVTPEEAIAQGQYPGVVKSEEWWNEVGYGVDIESLKKYKIPLMSFETWAKQNLAQF